MTDKTWLLSERLAADVADVRSLSSVDQKMLLQSIPPGEIFVTHRAAVRFVTRVDPHVDLESAVPGEGLATLLAHCVLPLLVLSEHMFVQIFLRDHPPLTDLALVLGLVVSEFLVHIKRVAIQTRFATDITDDRLLSMSEPDMVCQVTLDLELFAAKLARELKINRVLSCHVDLQLVLILVLVVAVIAAEQLRLLAVGLVDLVLALLVRVQRASLACLKPTLLAGINLRLGLLHVLTSPVRIKCVLLFAPELAEIAGVTVVFLFFHPVLLCYMV